MVHYADGKPLGDLTLRTLAMPSDANAAGDIFGGWVMAQMDLACGIRAAERAKGRVVTAAVDPFVGMLAGLALKLLFSMVIGV